jgi:cytidylate kinase
MDRTRDRFTRYFFGLESLRPGQYDLVANTGRMSLDEVVATVAATVRSEWHPHSHGPARLDRILTLARELGAGDTGFAPTLGARLGLRVFDRALLEQEAAHLGIPPVELAKIDERPSGIFKRFRAGSLHHRYVDALAQIMAELATQGDVLLVGRGANRFLGDWMRAFHVRLVAPMALRAPRVMEHRWLRQEPAQRLIAESDSRRSRFYQECFAANWSDPLEYHLTVNSGRLGPAAVDLIAFAAERFWGRQSGG